MSVYTPSEMNDCVIEASFVGSTTFGSTCLYGNGASTVNEHYIGRW